MQLLHFTERSTRGDRSVWVNPAHISHVRIDGGNAYIEMLSGESIPVQGPAEWVVESMIGGFANERDALIDIENVLADVASTLEVAHGV